ncbi:MAG: hypothetical protein JW810_06630 [Sedimentisphaerales bacterium]|nr:hypothetical protein [Sedimentisphaerales bacterium]
MKATVAIVVIMVIVEAFPCCGRASLIKIVITAEMIAMDETENLWEGDIDVEDMIYEHYIHDVEWTDVVLSGPGYGSDDFFPPSNGISSEISDSPCTTDPNHGDFPVVVTGNPPGACDADNVMFQNTLPLFATVPVRLLAWRLPADVMSVLSDIDLPASISVLSDWHEVKVCTMPGGGNPKKGECAFGIIGPVTDAVAVPETTTFVSLSLGMLLLGTRRRPAFCQVSGAGGVLVILSRRGAGIVR